MCLAVAVVIPGLLLAGCYHMRMNPEPLQREAFTVAMTPDRAFDVISDVLSQDGFYFDRHDDNTDTLVTEYRYFHKDTGISQPVGGRDYYYELRVTVRPAGDGATVALDIPALEMRASYVYDSDGELKTLSKRYPYEEYPGMFDLVPVDKELHRVETLIRRSVR